MKQVIDVLIPILFFAPACATYLGGPFIGIGITGVYLFFHYAHGSFRKYRDDPMEIVQLTEPRNDLMEVEWDPSPRTSNTSFIK